MQWIRLWLLCGAMLAWNASANAADVRQVPIDLTRVQKDMGQSVLGADAEDFATGVEFQWLLTEGRADFVNYCKTTDIRVLRLANMSRYSVRGPEATTKVWAAKNAKGNKRKYAQAIQTPWGGYFDPAAFYTFCRDNNIRVIPMFDAKAYYDAGTKEGRYFVNQPQYYKAAAKEAAYQLQWVKKHGFLDLTPVWEIGNECYFDWDPAQYVAFAREVIHQVRRVDPDIKLSVPFMAGTMDAYKRELTPELKSQNKETWWTRSVFKALGKDAALLTYAVIHPYNAKPNYAGTPNWLIACDRLAQSMPNARHLRFLATEWRYNDGLSDLTSHRRFDVGALWNTKFTLALMAYPKLDYPCTHSLLCFSGLGYYSDGKNWVLQTSDPKDRAHNHIIPDRAHQKRIVLGPYAVPMRMCNVLVASHPLMVDHHADLGGESSTIYYQDRKKGDLQWLVATNADRSSMVAVIVNTTADAQQIRFIPQGNHRVTGQATVETYTCDPDKLAWTAPPGDTDQLHDKTNKQSADKPVTLPPHSVVKVTLPLSQR